MRRILCTTLPVLALIALATVATAAEGGGAAKPLSVFDLYLHSMPVGGLLTILSFITISLGLTWTFTMRMEDLAPPNVSEEIHGLFAEGATDEAIEQAKGVVAGMNNMLGNVMLVYYLAVPTFILTGGLGYLHASRSPDPRRVQAACFALMLLLLAVGGLDLLGFRTLGPWSERGLVASLCGLSGYLSAYPFGYLISREKEKLAAFAWDGFGMALGYPTLLILMSHATLDQLMIQLAAFYGPLALCIPLLSGASARRKI